MHEFDFSTKKVYREAVQVLRDHGHEAELRKRYSGRFMYGKEVPGIVTDAGGPMVGWAIVQAVENLATRSGVTANDCHSYIPERQDNMATNMIYY